MAAPFPTNSIINGIARLEKRSGAKNEVEYCLNIGQKKWHGTQLKRYQGTGIPAHE